MLATPEGGCKHMRGEPASPTNPGNGRTDRPSEDASTGDKNMHKCMAAD